jgi:antitoxin component YwqK of YwqJK toxin-antitoxin module
MKYALIFSLIFVLVSCSNEPVLEDTLVVRNGLVFEVNEQQPFSGTSVSYYPNGQIQEKINYIDGDLGLFHESYHDNGQIRFIYTYDKEGKRKDGKFFSYFRNGSVEFESIFKDGKRDGTQTSYWISMGGDGGPKTITQFEEGNLTELSEFDRSGTLLLKEIYEGGLYGKKTILFDLVAEQKKKELAEKERKRVEEEKRKAEFLATQEKRRQEAQKEWRSNIVDFLNTSNIQPTYTELRGSEDHFQFTTVCTTLPFKLPMTFVVSFKDPDIEDIRERTTNCGGYKYFSHFTFSYQSRKKMWDIVKEDPLLLSLYFKIDKVHYEVHQGPIDSVCEVYPSAKKLCNSFYPDLGTDYKLDRPIIWEIKSAVFENLDTEIEFDIKSEEFINYLKNAKERD